MHRTPFHFAAPQAEPPIRLFLFDERILMLEGLCALLAPEETFRVIGTATRRHEALEQIAIRNPAVIVCDASEPSGAGFAVAEQGREIFSQGKFVFLDDRVERFRLDRAVRVGANGYFLRQRSFRALAAGLRDIARGERKFDPDVAEHIAQRETGKAATLPESLGDTARLTAREMEVLCHLARGMTVKQCAAELGLANSTVDNHKSRLMKKLGVHKATELAVIAVRAGLI
ncbi:MAG: response regulator transcription factor [Planctomycetales bacterium]|nr:response regulator transcription factor [Planctomycetales bacterium]